MKRIKNVLMWVFRGVVIVVVVVLAVMVDGRGKTIRCNKETIAFQRRQMDSMQVSLGKAIDKTAISFSIAPEINNKVTSAFGCTKYVTLQYYFTLDGKAMILNNPDSVYRVAKEYY